LTQNGTNGTAERGRVQTGESPEWRAKMPELRREKTLFQLVHVKCK